MFLEIFTPSLINGMLGRELTAEQKAKILENGLYRLTTDAAAKQILDENGIAHFKPSNRVSSYSMLGKKSVFMYSQKPSMFDIIRNIKDFSLDKVSDKRFIHIKGVDALNIIEDLKFRPNDYAAMYPGRLDIPAEVFTFEQVYEKELKNSITEKLGVVESLRKAFSSTIVNGYKEIYNKIKSSVEYEIARYNIIGKETKSESKTIEDSYEENCNVYPGDLIRNISVSKDKFISVRDNSITLYNNDYINRLDGQQQTIYFKEGSNISYDGNTNIKVNNTVIDLTKVNAAGLQHLLKNNNAVNSVEIATYNKGILHNTDGPAKLMYSVDKKGNMILENKLYSFEGYCLDEKDMKKNIPSINIFKTQKEQLADKEVLDRGRESFSEYANYKEIYEDADSIKFQHNYDIHENCNYKITNKSIQINQKDSKTGQLSKTNTYYFKNDIFYDGNGTIYVNGREMNLHAFSQKMLENTFINSKDISAFEYENHIINKDRENVLPSKVLYELDNDNKVNIAKTLYNVDGYFYDKKDIQKIIPSTETFNEKPKFQVEKKKQYENINVNAEKKEKQTMREIIDGLLSRINKEPTEKIKEERDISMEDIQFDL